MDGGGDGHGDIDIASVAALIGEPARAQVLLALTDGRPLAASTLAAEAGVAPSTISAHLSRLLDGGLLTVEAAGRHRYYRLASPQVADAVEALARLAPFQPVRSLRQASHSAAIRQARTCYDHLAGRLGVALTDALVAEGVVDAGIDLDGSHWFELTAAGERRLRTLGLQLDAAGRRPLVRSCLDWTERQPHVAGLVGARLLERFFALAWLVRGERRAVRLTAEGRQGFAEQLGVPMLALT